ncbi:MAG: GGDEF domain-containing protein [Clostridia bacterium]|nr:GGDEF domain-containing protein [Clostridia bacterium]
MISLKQEKLSLSVGLRWKRILAVILLIVYQVTGQLVLSSLMIRHAEDQCIDRLRDATAEFSSNYYEHAMSDREQLHVVADMLAVLMNEGTHDLHTHLASFEQRGMLDWLQVLLPDGSLITGSGTYDLSQQLSFREEAARLPFISNVSSGYVDTGKQVIRSAVPITYNGETIGVLYGVYDLTAGHAIDGVNAYDGQAYTFILESDTGNYILDGLRGHQNVAFTNGQYDPKPGYNLESLAADLAACREGFSAFRSRTVDGYMYIYYAPIGINNWMAMVSVQESVALAYARESLHLALLSIIYISLGVVIYFIITHFIEQKVQSKNRFVSGIQSQLLEVYHDPENFTSALLAVADRAQSGAVFLLDSQAKQPSTLAGRSESLISAFQQSPALMDELFALCRQQPKVQRLRVNSRALQPFPALNGFLQANQQHSLVLAPLITPEGDVHQVMGAFAPDNQDAPVLLNAMAVDFFMAASNIDYLHQLEIASTVDALTGVLNRTSYHLRLDQLGKRPPENFACVYVDVNDLHAINNRFGHEKGDAMLCTIASALRDAFGLRNVYRFGGDEFVVLAEGVTSQWVDEKIAQADAAIRAEGYTVSIGSDWAQQPDDVDEMIRNAESRMYKAKYLFYQQKEKQNATLHLENKSVRRLLTENADVDAFLQVAEHHYHGVYFVDLATDAVREVLAHGYFHTALQHTGHKFSPAFQAYISEAVDKQSRRNLQNFFVIQHILAQLQAGIAPVVEYTKVNGDRSRLTVHPSPRFTPEQPESIWVFEIK